MGESSTVCGFIGLGSQGAPIARRMMEGGYPLLLWARNSSTLDSFRGSNATFAASIEDLAARADHIGICVRDDADVLEVGGRLIAAMRLGARLVIHSTTHPDTCILLAGQAAARGVAFVEAPVSGGGPGAAAGELTVMTAGSRTAAADAAPVFATFASLVIHLGEHGAAQTAKLINNSLLAANLGLVRSAVSLGLAHGLDRAALLALLQASSGRSYALNVFSRIPEGQAFTHADTLLDKIRLLGEVSDCADFQVLRDAALALRRAG